MAISDTQKVDFLWKKLAYGKTKTDTGTNKQGFEESIASPLLLRADKLWTQSGSIPSSISTVSAVVTVYSGSTTVECTEDLTAADNRTWKTNLTDWISPEFGADYLVSVYIGTSGVTGASIASTVTIAGNKISAGGLNEDQWYFDYQSGVLHFIGTNIPTAITSGVTGKSIYITGARYVGSFGVGSSSLSNGTSNVIIPTTDGNVVVYSNGNNTVTITGTGVNIAGYANFGSGIITTTGNANVGNLNFGSGVITGTGNITSGNANLGNLVTANYFTGNGSLLTGVAASSSTTATSAGTVTASSQPNITSTGTLVGLTVSGNVSFTGANVSLGSVSNLHITGGTSGYFLTTDGSGGLSWAAQTSLTATVDEFTANGTDTTFTLSITPSSENVTMVAVQGVLQPKSSYSLMGPQLTFDAAPPVSAFIEVTTFSGGAGGSGGSSALTWNIASSNATMTTNNGYFVDTSGGAKTMTLPSSATLGDTIRINDLAGSFSTNNLTVARNGHKIQGVADNLLVDADQSSFGLVYSNSTYGWKVLEL